MVELRDVSEVPASKLTGRELDRAVAIEVMGYTKGPAPHNACWCLLPPGVSSEDTQTPEGPCRDWDRFLPRFSIDETSAWRVARLMRSRGYLVVIKFMPQKFAFIDPGDPSEYNPHPSSEISGSEGKAYCDFQWIPVDDDEDVRRRMHHNAQMAATAEVAICRAALTAVRYEEQ